MHDGEWEGAITVLAGRIAERPDDVHFQESQSCPVCGSPVKIHAGRYRRSASRMIGVTIECSRCSQAIAFDLIEAEA